MSLSPGRSQTPPARPWSLTPISSFFYPVIFFGSLCFLSQFIQPEDNPSKLIFPQTTWWLWAKPPSELLSHKPRLRPLNISQKNCSKHKRRGGGVGVASEWSLTRIQFLFFSAFPEAVVPPLGRISRNYSLLLPLAPQSLPQMSSRAHRRCLGTVASG